MANPKTIEALDLRGRRDAARAEVQRQEKAGGASVKVTLQVGDARALDWIPDESVHLVVCSPPYWTLKDYNEHPDQLGHVEDYEQFLDELDRVWTHAFRALVPRRPRPRDAAVRPVPPRSTAAGRAPPRRSLSSAPPPSSAPRPPAARAGSW